MKTRLVGLVFALGTPWFFLLTSCTNDPDRDALSLVVQGAADTEVLRSKDGKRVQINYKLSLPFPAVAIGKTETQRLERERWRPCEPEQSDWDMVPDAREQKLIHQLTRHWTRDGDLLTVHLRYLSRLAEPVKAGTRPEDSIQHVIILLDRYGTELGQAVKNLKLNC